MKEKLYLTEDMKKQIQEGLKNSEAMLGTHHFKTTSLPNVILLERVLLEILPYSIAAEIFKEIDDIIANHQKNQKQ